MDRVNTQEHTKLMTMWIMANSLKNSPRELTELVEKNRTYFPFIDNEQLKKMREKSVDYKKSSIVNSVPVFSKFND